MLQSQRFSFQNVKNSIFKFIRTTLSDPDSFNIFCFLSLNFAFAFVELFYGIVTNSLGLISDSFHMFFDCSALMTGLFASIISKWPKNKIYTYGYRRAETLAGFINALILVFISFFIIKESVERIFDQPHIHHHRLFLVSVLGFLVNVIGIFVFHHGQPAGSSCCHSGHSHEHHDSHKHHPHDVHMDLHHKVDVTSESVIIEVEDPFEEKKIHKTCNSSNHSHHEVKKCSHTNHHKTEHQHGNQIIRGVFLHILADTLGSVAVIISSYLIANFKIMIADTICSLFCAVLIFISAIPLLKETTDVFMEKIPLDMETKALDALEEIKRLPGLYSITDNHIWSICTKHYCCTLKCIIAPTVDSHILTERITKIITDIGVNDVTVQIDKAF